MNDEILMKTVDIDVKIPISINKFMNFKQIDISDFASKWIVIRNFSIHKFEDINQKIVGNLKDLQNLLKYSTICEEKYLFGRFSFFMLENEEILFKAKIHKNLNKVCLKVVLGIFSKIKNYTVEPFAKHLIEIFVINLFEVLKFRHDHSNIILEEEIDIKMESKKPNKTFY